MDISRLSVGLTVEHSWMGGEGEGEGERGRSGGPQKNQAQPCGIN